MENRILSNIIVIFCSILFAVNTDASPLGSIDKHKSSSSTKPAKEKKKNSVGLPSNKDSKKSGSQKLTDLPDNFDDLPTFIKSNSLSVNSDKRVFQYLGNVEVKKGDLTLTADKLDGTYDENNQIKTLVARNNVVITKGDSIRATGKTATYDKGSDLMILTDSPEIHQNNSVLTADVIKIFLQENRSVAEGQVNMKLIKATPSPTPSPTPGASPAPASPAPSPSPRPSPAG